MKRILFIAILLMMETVGVAKASQQDIKYCRPVKEIFNGTNVAIFKDDKMRDTIQDASFKIFKGEIFETYAKSVASANVQFKGEPKWLNTDAVSSAQTMLDGDKRKPKSEYSKMDIKFFLHDDSLYFKVLKLKSDSTTSWFYVIDQTHNELIDTLYNKDFNVWKSYPLKENSKDFRISPENHLVTFIYLPKVEKIESLKVTFPLEKDTLIRNNKLERGDTLISEMLIANDNDTIWIEDTVIKARKSGFWVNQAWIIAFAIIIIVAICFWKRKELASAWNKLAKERGDSIDTNRIEEERQEQGEQESVPSTQQESGSDTLKELPTNLLDDDKRNLRELLDELPNDYDEIKALIERRHGLDLRIKTDEEREKYNKQIESILSQQGETRKANEDADAGVVKAEEKNTEKRIADLEKNFKSKLQKEKEKIEKEAKQKIEKAENKQKNEKEKYEKRIKSLTEKNTQIGRQLGETAERLRSKEAALKKRESELAASQVTIDTLQDAQAKFTSTLTFVPYAQDYAKSVMELIEVAEKIRNSATKLLDKKSVEDPYHIMKCLAKFEKAIAAINMSQFYTETKMIAEGQMVLNGTTISTYDQKQSKEQLSNSLKIYFFDAYLHRFINGVAVLNESCIGLDRLVAGLKKDDVNEFLKYRDQLLDCVEKLEIILESTHLFDKVGQKTDLRVTQINAGFSAGDILEIDNCIVYLKGSYRPDTKIYVKAQS